MHARPKSGRPQPARIAAARSEHEPVVGVAAVERQPRDRGAGLQCFLTPLRKQQGLAGARRGLNGDDGLVRELRARAAQARAVERRPRYARAA